MSFATFTLVELLALRDALALAVPEAKTKTLQGLSRRLNEEIDFRQQRIHQHIPHWTTTRKEET